MLIREWRSDDKGHIFFTWIHCDNDLPVSLDLPGEAASKALNPTSLTAGLHENDGRVPAASHEGPILQRASGFGEPDRSSLRGIWTGLLSALRSL